MPGVHDVLVVHGDVRDAGDMQRHALRHQFAAGAQPRHVERGLAQAAADAKYLQIRHAAPSSVEKRRV
jgi:hypothetical protein